jgi:signal transduction histidine kinase
MRRGHRESPDTSGCLAGQGEPGLTPLDTRDLFVGPSTLCGGGVRTKRLFVVIAALLAGAAAAWLAANRAFEPYQTAAVPLALLVGWSFIGSGLAACSVRPNSPLGTVMVLTGFAWFASFLNDAHQSVLFSIGTAVQSVYLVGFVYLVLTFPSGRLRTRLDRVLIWSGAALVTLVALVSLLFSNSRAVLCDGCPGNAFQVARDDALANALAQLERIGGVMVVVAALALLVARWRRASALQRRTVAPVVWAGGLTLAALVVSVTNDALGHPLGEIPKQLLFAALATLPVGMVLVLLQRRLARAAVAGLVVELGERDVATDLGQALARALGDPSLGVAYWFPAGARYVDSDGRPAQLPPPDSGRMTTVVERGGHPIAALIHDRALAETAELIDSVCAAAAMTLENERLQAELRARLGELEASRARLVDATEAERRRIERDLHDGTQQRLVSLAMSLGLLNAKLPEDPAAAKPIAEEARAALAVALEELRELSHGIHPAVLTERGLGAALEELADRAALPAYAEVSIDERPCPAVEAAAYFVVSEALTNAAKHSHAGEVRITASRDRDVLIVEVVDDGIGGAVLRGGSGLRGLTDRVEALGGRLVISSPPGRGTTIRADLPCA